MKREDLDEAYARVDAAGDRWLAVHASLAKVITSLMILGLTACATLYMLSPPVWGAWYACLNLAAGLGVWVWMMGTDVRDW